MGVEYPIQQSAHLKRFEGKENALIAKKKHNLIQNMPRVFRFESDAKYLFRHRNDVRAVNVIKSYFSYDKHGK